MPFLSHFSPKPLLFCSPICRRLSLPKFPFYPSSFLKSPYCASFACHVSSAGGGVQMESSYPEEKKEASASVDSVTRDLKNQRLETDGGDESKRKLKALEDLNWDHSFIRELPGDPRSDTIPREVLHACYSKVSPSAEVENPQLVAWSESVAELLELDPKEFERPEFPLFFSGASPLAGSVPYAQSYGGHQFGMWAGQLGDGRAITIGEILNSKSERWELQLKGAGKTPYSRFADGLAVLRSSIREFLCSEAMHFLRIPTTRALCLVTTGKFVTRDMFYDGNPKEEPGAIVCRVTQSFLRFGSYQLHASRGKEDLDIVRTLADYAIRYHFPHIENMNKSESLSFSIGDEDHSVVDLTSNKYAAWVVEVAERTAYLVARWQGVGFTHGVLNTDNMSILGLTVDYGPFGFLDAFDPSFTPNTTDLPGRRYCFANQPDIGLWNVAQFATTLAAAKLIDDKEANYAMERYGTKFMDEYQAVMTKKLGLPKYNKQIISKLLNNMAVDKVDYTNFFRALANVKADPNIPEDELLAPLKSVLLDIGKERKEAWISWVQSYIQELASSGISDEQRKSSMNSVNPKYVLRNYLCQSAIDAAQFWCLQTLHEVVRVKYTTMSSEEKNFIRKSVFSMACYELIDGKSAVRVLESPAFIRNKLAQVLVTLIYFEYPLIWSSMFVDFLHHLSKGSIVIDMFCRVLNSLDDELISLDYPRTPVEITVAARVKNAMRQQCVEQIVRAWYDIVSIYRSSDFEVCTSVLDCMRRYISWIDINLIANDAFIPLLFELILADGLSEQFRGAAVGCVLAVVSKRMDPHSKRTLLQTLQISRVFGLISEGGESELVLKVAALLTGYAVEVLECVKQLNAENADAMKLLNEVLPSVLYVMQNCEVDTTFSNVQFLSGYVATMKSLSPLKEEQILHLGQILEVIRTHIRYDPMYRNNLDVLDKIGIEEEDRMAEYRKDLLVLLRSVGRVAPEVTHVFIRNSLATAVTSSADRNVEEVEAALTLLYALGESMSDEALRTGAGLLSDLVPMLLHTKLPCHSNRLVALVYLETVTRYMKFIQENTRYIPVVLATFLDERGLHHPNVHVSRRASYLFMRVVKMLKSKLVPFIENILQSLQDTIARLTSMNYTSKELSGSEDGSHIFEAIGLLIGMEDVPPEKQSDYLSSLLSPLCQQVQALLLNAKMLNPEESTAKVANIQQIIVAINSLSKGFSERLVTSCRPAIGLMFKQTLDVLLQILVVFPKVESVRCKVTSFIHRMVDTLGASVFPYLPKALEQLLAESEPKEMVGFLVLLNQLICKFNTLVHDILDEVFPAIAGRIFNLIPRDTFPSGPGTNTEEIREVQELQRTFYTFLHVIATHDLSSVFLSPKSRAYLDPIMQLLLYTSCNHKDYLVRKACVQIFIRLIKDWCARPFGEEKVPGFRSFMIEAFAMNCCFYSVLDKSFEFADANTLFLFGEIVLALKVMYEKFGHDFLVHFVTKVFPSAHCPQDLAEEYCQKLQGSDFKALKSFYQSLMEKLRVQQNGSVGFR